MDMMIDPHMTPRKLTNLRSNPMLREMRVKPLLLGEVEPSANVILDKKDNRVAPELQDSRTFRHVTVASEPERNGVFLTRSCVHVTDIFCGVVYEATLASLVLFRSYCYVQHHKAQMDFLQRNPRIR